MLRRLFGPLVRELLKLVKLEWLTLRLQIRIWRFSQAKAKHKQTEARLRQGAAELGKYIQKGVH